MVQDMVGSNIDTNSMPGFTGSAITRHNTATLNTGNEASVLLHNSNFLLQFINLKNYHSKKNL